MDKSRGRAQMINGDIFYSPNSKRTVVPLEENTTNPFLPDTPFGQRPNYWAIDTSTYEQPRWHSTAWGWIAFYDKAVLSTSSPLFRTLEFSNVHRMPEPDNGFTMARWQMDEWIRLDLQLEKGYHILRQHYITPTLSTHGSISLGYTRPHKHYGTALECIKKSRQWFIVTLALWSCAIAGAETRERQLEDTFWAREHWKRLLIAKGQDVGIDQGWIDLLLDSPVASFSNDVERTGTFLKIQDGIGSYTQPDPTWYYQYGVPVWYPWDKELASNPLYHYLAPLPEQLQDATTFITKSPSRSLTPPALQVSASAIAPASEPQCPRQTHSTAKMDEFFRLRSERNNRILARESPEKRQQRLSREKQPPTTSARVFEWIVNREGEYVCEEVSRKDRSDVLGSYTNDVMRYDAFMNEWHICKVWGDRPESQDDEDDDDLELYSIGWNEGEGQVAAGHVGNIRPAYEDLIQGDAWVPPKQDEQQNITLADKLEGEILNVAELYFGYTPRIPLPQVAPLPDEQARKSFCRSFGLIWAGVVDKLQEVFQRPAVAAVTDFFRRLAQRSSILHKDEWDLFSDNRQSVKTSPRLSKFRIVFSEQEEQRGGEKVIIKTKYYMLNLDSQRTVPWNIAVSRASDALTICRLDASFNEYNIVDFLLTNAIRFHTLQCSSTVPRSLDVPRVQPSLHPLIRDVDYMFNGRDYLAYRERCRAILSHSRGSGRAALMFGNVMWRLAIHTVKCEAVYAGPSGWSLDPSEMLVVRDANGVEYIDDKLSPQEQEALCGTYHCFTGGSAFCRVFFLTLLRKWNLKGKGSQFALKSWYMPPKTAERSNQDIG